MPDDQHPTGSAIILKQRLDVDFALRAADLGVWELDVTTGRILWDDRCRELFNIGSSGQQVYDEGLSHIHPDDHSRVETAIEQALDPQTNDDFDQSYRIIAVGEKGARWVRSVGRAYFTDGGELIRFGGIAQDVTLAQQHQLALEELTEQLSSSNEEQVAINEELTSSNEEYAAINEELAEANSLLARSNENLQTFAYIASHDLQEPLRKIQSFGDILKTRLTGSISSEDLSYLERMQTAASRMSTLIRDLLSFSRISTQRNTDEPVALNEVANKVLDTLDMIISQSNAQVQVDVLPLISGDAVQLGQLFQNLLSNALKFHRPDVPPQIHIRSELVAAEDLPASVNPARRSPTYECIQMIDNGIGFEEKYLDRIFQIFQRLHGKNEFAGTGVGLAICEKVVTNHGGVITASSQPGQGSTFSIYLPALT